VTFLVWLGWSCAGRRLRTAPYDARDAGTGQGAGGMFRDTTGRKPLGRQLQEEWKDAWKAVGIEATAFNFVSLRLGYLRT